MENMTYSQFRKKYPQYDDLSNEQLRVALEPKGIRLQSTGEDIGSAIQSGLRRGVAGIVGLPGAFSNTVDDAIEWATGRPDQGPRHFGFPEAMDAVDETWDKLNDATFGNNVGGTEYAPATVGGRAAQLGAELMPGAGVAGAASKAASGARGAAATVGLPTATGTAAGEAARALGASPEAEAMARGLGTLAGPVAGAAASRIARGARPTPQQAKAVETLRRSGVEPTAGQARDSLSIRNMEASTTKGQRLQEAQFEQFGRAAIDRAIPPAIKKDIKLPAGVSQGKQVAKALDDVGDLMGELAVRNDLPVTPKLADDLDDVAMTYLDLVGRGSESPYITQIANDVRKSNILTGADYQRIRSNLSKLTKTNDPSTRSAAIDMIDVIDDAMEKMLLSKGNKTEWTKYKGARKAYRDLLTLDRAYAAAGPRKSGNITPDVLDQSVKAREGTRAVNAGDSTFSELTDAGRQVLGTSRTTSTPEMMNARSMINAMAPGGVGALVGGSVGGPVGTAIGGAAGVAAPWARNAMVASRAGQKFLKRGFDAARERIPLSARGVGTVAPSTRPWWEDDEDERNRR